MPSNGTQGDAVHAEWWEGGDVVQLTMTRRVRTTRGRAWTAEVGR